MVRKAGVLMFIRKKPYFMTNKEWYYYDRKEFCIKLTDKAPKKARESYEQFQSVYEEENGES